MVAIAMAVNAISGGVYHQGMAIFFLPIQRGLDISRAATSLPMSVARFTGGVQSFIIGSLVDRFGPNKILLFAGFMGGLGFLLFSRVNSYLMFVVVLLLVLATAFQAAPDQPGFITCARWFYKKRGLALTLTTAGYSVGTMIITPLVALSIPRFGWQNTSVMLGILVWIIVIPLSTKLKASPEMIGLHPDGADFPPPSPKTKIDGKYQTLDSNLRDALRTRFYWQFALVIGLRSMVWAVVSIHIIGIFTWRGVDESMAGIMIGLIHGFAIPIALLMAWSGDRWYKNKVVSLGDLTILVGIALLVIWDSLGLWQVILITLMLAPNQGTWPLGWATVAEEFGRKNFGIIRGSLQTVMGIFSVGPPIFAGWIFDQTGSYFLVLTPSIIFLAIAALFMWTLPIQNLAEIDDVSVKA
jgi:sugar phosphate permease